MIPFKINGSRYQIPTSWDDVTYSQYITLLTIPGTLIHYVHVFSGIPLETLQNAELKNLEKISIALSFLTISPKYDQAPTGMVGPYVMPKDVTVQSLGQFEDLKALLQKVPLDLNTTENRLLIADLYLEACAIYVTKIKFNKYDSNKVHEVKEELKNYSSSEVIQTGSFFLFKPLNILRGTMTRSQNIKQRLRKLIQGLPGYQKTLDSLLYSSTQRKP